MPRKIKKPVELKKFFAYCVFKLSLQAIVDSLNGTDIRE